MLQSLDVVLNKHFNDRMRQKWMGLDVYRRHEMSKGGNLKRSSPSMVTTWVNEAWENIPAEMMKKSFPKTGISNMMGLKTNICDKIQENQHQKKKNQKKPGTQMSI